MLNLSYLAARDRATGEVKLLAFAANIAGGRENGLVGKKYNEFLAAAGGELRAEYSHILFVIDNNVRGHHDFPDPAIAKRAHLAAQVAQAQADHSRAIAAANQVKSLAQKAKSAAKLEDDHAARVEELKEQLAAIKPLPAAPFVTIEPPKIPEPPFKPNDEGTPAEQLGRLNDADLAEVAKTYDVPSEGVSRDDLIAAILKKADYAKA